MDRDYVLSKISSENTTAHELLSETYAKRTSRFYRTQKTSPDFWTRSASTSRMLRIIRRRRLEV